MKQNAPRTGVRITTILVSMVVGVVAIILCCCIFHCSDRCCITSRHSSEILIYKCIDIRIRILCQCYIRNRIIHCACCLILTNGICGNFIICTVILFL